MDERQAAAMGSRSPPGVGDQSVIEKPERRGEDRWPVSHVQQSNILMPEAGLGHAPISVAYMIEGPLEVSALDRSLRRVIACHGALRTAIRNGPRGLEQVEYPTSDTKLLVVAEDAESSRPLAPAEAIEIASQWTSICFNREIPPLMSAKLLSVQSYQHVLFLAFDHLIFDGWSLGVFLEDLTVGYDLARKGEGEDIGCPPPSYGEYALWEQQNLLRSADWERATTFWEEALSHSGPFPELPLRSKAKQSTWNLARASMSLTPSQQSALRGGCARHGVTTVMSIITALSAAVWAVEGSALPGVVIPTASRFDPRFFRTIGWFANAMVVPLDVSGTQTIGCLARHVRDQVLASMQHSWVPFGEVVRLTAPGKLQMKSSVPYIYLDTMVAETTLSLGTAHGRQLPLDRDRQPFNGLRVVLDELGGAFRVHFEYDQGSYDRVAVESVIIAFERALCVLSAEPETDLAEFRRRVLPVLELSDYTL